MAGSQPQNTQPHRCPQRSPGYAAGALSLKIAGWDADVIRTICELYLKQLNARLVEKAVDAVRLKTPVRTLISGEVRGAVPTSYSRATPVCARCIRHHPKLCPGQHPPLTDPKVCDSICNKLQGDAARDRKLTKAGRIGSKATVSPLAGKISDQPGGRLSPGRRSIQPCCTTSLAHLYSELARSGTTFNDKAKTKGATTRLV